MNNVYTNTKIRSLRFKMQSREGAKLHENSRNSKRMRIKIKVAKVLDGYFCRFYLTIAIKNQQNLPVIYRSLAAKRKKWYICGHDSWADDDSAAARLFKNGKQQNDKKVKING
ncbi:MAG: hypothetical protein LBJ57_00050 [Prevotellaceae bacterium]|jgi:hypothetical protein|nr:hypothetical protein [Prevotellaceae bacterium]